MQVSFSMHQITYFLVVYFFTQRRLLLITTSHLTNVNNDLNVTIIADEGHSLYVIVNVIMVWKPDR